MLKVQNLSFGYSRRFPILENFSLEIPSGGIYGLLGKNGAGKSTLLYLMCGLLTPDSGRVVLNGRDVRRREPATLSDIFIVPEEFSLPAVTLARYIEINAPFYPNFSVEDLKRHLAVMGMDYDMNLGRLSMGQKKKAFMCFALACNTPLLLMDEPTNGLDIPSKSAFRRFIASTVDENRAVVISSHQVRDIDKVLDHVIIMDNHRVLLDRSVAEISSRLKFVTSPDRELGAKALYVRPSLGGADLILPNTDGEDSEVNLETLFDFALLPDGRLERIFSTDNPDFYNNGTK